MNDPETFHFNPTKQDLKELDQELREYLDVNSISTGIESAFRSDRVRPSSTFNAKNLDPILEEGALNNQIVEYKPNQSLAE